jgi:tetratricopeptide (TPR) repeat protein
VPISWVLLTLAAYGAYCNSFEGRLFFDDLSSVMGNPHLQAYTNPVNPSTGKPWEGDWERLKYACGAEIDTPFAGRPIVSLSFALNHLWAFRDHPAEIPSFYGVLPPHHTYYHYVNFWFHVVVGLVLWHFLRFTFTAPSIRAYTGRHADLWAGAVALLWMVHPLNTETVVYVTQRTEQILSFFLLLTMYASARSNTSRFPIAWQVLSVVACIFGMASKENMVGVPLLVVLYDRAFFYTTWRETFQKRGLFYVPIFLTYGVLAYINLSLPRGQSVGFDFERMNWWEYLITQCWCLLRYLQLSIVPYGLCVDYGRLAILDPVDVIPGAIVVLSLLGLTVWGWIHKPWVGFIGAWFFFILAPTSSFIPIVTEVGAERRMYLPLAAVLIAIGIGLAMLIRKLSGRDVDSLSDNGRIWCIASVLVLRVVFAVSSFYRNRVYHTESTLYGHIPKTFPWNERGNNNYAKICIDEGRIEEAEQLLNRALEIDPEYSDAFTNRGIIYHRRKQMDRAIQNATEALRWNPMNPSAWNNRGNAFIELKLFYKAEQDFSKLVSLNPRGVEGYYGRANTHYLAGQPAKALTDIDAVIERSPGDYKAYNTRGNILKQMGNYEKAVTAFSTGIDLLIKEAASARHPCLPAVLKAMKGDLTEHQIALQFGNRQTLGTILGNRADAYRNLIDKFPNAKQNMFDDLTRAIILNIDNPVYFLARGQQNYNYKNYPQALADFNEVINRTQAMGQPMNVDAYRGLIVTAYELKNWDVIWQAEKTLREAGVPVDPATLKKWREESGREPLP